MSDSTSPRDRAGRLAYAALFAIALPAALALWALTLDRRLDLPSVGWPATGLVLAIAGGAAMTAAVVTLRVSGGGWPMSPYPPRQFVTRGIYGVVAHPLYTGSVVLAAGASMLAGSPAGFWIVTPVLAASCLAFVWGFEADRTRRLFGARLTPPLIRLPAPDDGPPSRADRLSVYLIALLPWYLVYAAINVPRSPSGAIPVVLALDERIAVIPWTEIVYFVSYPLVLFAPLVARSARDLRRMVIRSWVATAGSALVYFSLPTLPPQKPAPQGSVFTSLLEWERSFDAPNTALPAFHVIWTMLVADVWTSAFPRLRRWRWPLFLAIGASCVTTGMHAVVDVIAGLVLGAAFMHIETVWRVLLRGAEIASNSWREWRAGGVRFIVHGLYPGAGAAIGIAMATALAGERWRGADVVIGLSAIAGAALWAQLIEGSPALLRPYGYYGGILGGVMAIAVVDVLGGPGLQLLAAYAVTATVVQAFGRVRCLVQGCCHGRAAAEGIRVRRPESRVVRMAGLEDVPLHPTALYSILWSAVMLLVLLRLWLAHAPLAFIAGAYFILGGLERFVEEHYRGEPQTRVVAGLRLYQWLSIASVIGGAVLTAIPSLPAPPPESISAATALAATCFGVFTAAAYGADFPEANWRFSRLA